MLIKKISYNKDDFMGYETLGYIASVKDRISMVSVDAKIYET
jgi:hypothetical protein